MGSYQHGEAVIHYDEAGEGFPVLLLAPGGMRSAADYWENTPWNPVEHLAPHHRVIAMDQRNAGRSTGPISATDGWHTFTEDQLGLMDHLGIEQFHVLGMCIGGPFAFGLIESAPDRVASAVLLQPIGRDNNSDAFFAMYDEWSAELRPHRPDVSETDWAGFRDELYGGDDLVFNTSRDQLADCRTPLLVLMGDDVYHPRSTSLAIADLAPDARLIEQWKDPAHLEGAKAAVADFLATNTPG